jgi:preprotein translocase subunit SecB
VAEQNPQQNINFSLEKIYLKDISYEAPGAPRVFLRQEAPDITVQLGIGHRPLESDQGFFEVVLTVTVNAKHKENTIFLVEVQQAGVFRITGVAGEALARALEIACPHVLLPFVRETVNELVGKGGFPQLLINPVNFEALYEQKRTAQQPAAGQA